MPYKAFVSSTFEDLAQHRRAVIDSLRRAGFVVDPMEDWTSDSRAPKEFSRSRVEQCDLMVLLVGNRLGFVPGGEDRSITQLEYDCARSAGLDVLTFLRDANEAEIEEPVQDWRGELEQTHGVSYFDDRPESVELGPALARWLQREVEQRVPRQIRAVPEDFGGRGEQVAQAVSAVRSGESRLVCVTGLGGTGKSVLASAIASELTGRFRGGHLFIDLHGTTKEPLPVTAAMQHVVRSLDPDARNVDDAAELEGLYRSLLAERQVVILLDNAADRTQVAQLLPPGENIAIVTSRQRFALPGAMRIELGGLSQEEGEQFLLRVCPEAAGHESTIVRLCEGLPLALRIAGDTIMTRPDLAPEGFVRRLTNEQKRLTQLSGDADLVSVPASLSLSYELLTPAQQSALRDLSVFRGLFDSEALEAIWVMDEDDAVDRVGSLMQHSLVEWQEADGLKGYRLHDLVRLFGRGQLADEDIGSLQRRHITHYATTLAEAAIANRRGEDGLAPFDFARSNIDSALTNAASLSADGAAEALQIAEALLETDGFLNKRLTREQRIGWMQLAISAAGIAGSSLCQSRLYCLLAACFANESKYEPALVALEQATQLAEAEGHLNQISHIENQRGQVFWRSGDPQEALRCFNQSLEIAQQTQDVSEQCDLHINLAIIHRQLRNWETSEALAEEGLRMAEQIGFKKAESQAAGLVSLRYLEKGEAERALKLAERSLAVARSYGDRHQTGVAMGMVGNAHRDLGALERAIELQTASREIMEELEDPYFSAEASWQLGCTLERAGDLSRAADEMDKRRAYRQSVGAASAERDARKVDELRKQAQVNGSSGTDNLNP